jgi:hypothetical protein
MSASGTIADIARVIQLATAPVFLLTGIGALINVLNTRLGRSIDRGRIVARHIHDAGEDADAGMKAELALISMRVKLMYRAIIFATFSALLNCIIIAELFISAVASFHVSTTVAVLFVAAMLALIIALLLFVREVFFATRALRIGPH